MRELAGRGRLRFLLGERETAEKGATDVGTLKQRVALYAKGNIVLRRPTGASTPRVDPHLRSERGGEIVARSKTTGSK